ncbi:LytR/AlgR family response regulator transcription factor [Algibacillus agarilyticus]|uniref:LytR/AlgR family response regulator transcription factor n=1 Tax=Algibacillus agarilyticus TaxID=2234133 RepID=UPI000DCF6AFB|nr:LytTR family DNA-binding domain-containing protein [Algibacillus agarilyticus]
MTNQTTKIKTLIIDDEPLALSLLRAKLSKFEKIDIIGECKNGREAIQSILDHTPDLIFLDIQMPGLNGLDVIQKIQTELMPLVIFATAFEQYALDAFDVNAVDYILKPLDDSHIKRAVERAIVRLQSQESNQETNQEKSKVIQAIHAINNRQTTHLPSHENKFVAAQDRKIVIKDGDEITLVKQDNIEWIDAAGDYCCLHAEGVTHIKRTTIREMLEELDADIFKRVHRSTIVNLKFITKVNPLPKGEYFLQLGENERVKVSRTYKDAIKDYLA